MKLFQFFHSFGQIMSQVEDIVRKIIETSPAGNDEIIVNDIKSLLNNSDSNKLISKLFNEQYTKSLNEGGDIKLIRLNNGKYSILSNYNYNRDYNKFFDINEEIQFNYDFINNKVIDIENELSSNITINEEINNLQKQLNEYLSECYNDESIGMVIPFSEGYKIIIVGERLNDSNYYNGKWVSVYSYDNESKGLSNISKIKIHYYEDGNVLLNNIEESDNIGSFQINELINEINKFDTSYETKILKKINELNENKFKNLRRLMPISRAKIQWGKSIGNYKLGQNVIGGKY